MNVFVIKFLWVGYLILFSQSFNLILSLIKWEVDNDQIDFFKWLMRLKMILKWFNVVDIIL